MSLSRGIFMYRIMPVFPKVKVRVPQYMTYSNFGIREYEVRHHRHHHHTLSEGTPPWKQRGRFICTGVPGTGFFERITESDAYEQMVRKYHKKTSPSFWKHFLKREFSFEKEMALVDKALKSEPDGMRNMILSAYSNCLGVAKSAEELERVVIGLKEKMHKRSTKTLTSAITHYRNLITQLESEMKICRLSLKDLALPEDIERYKRFCEKFAEVVETRRVWSMVNKDGKLEMVRVFLDIAVFDYMCVEEGTPMLRDAEGVCYYLFPNFMVRARSTVDFDVISIHDLTIDYRETSGESLTLNRRSSVEVFGRSIGEVYFREIETSFYFAHRSVAQKLVHYIHEYQSSCVGR